MTPERSGLSQPQLTKGTKWTFSTITFSFPFPFFLGTSQSLVYRMDYEALVEDPLSSVSLVLVPECCCSFPQFFLAAVVLLTFGNRDHSVLSFFAV